MKRLMNLTPLVKRPSLHVRDETMKRSIFVSSTFTVLKRGLDPFLLSLLSYLHTSLYFTSTWKILEFSLFQFDAYKTIKAIEIFCIKAFASG